MAAILEPRQGGRWYEKGVDGSECDWGTVLVWDPPARVVVSWHLNGRSEREPDRSSEVDVRFYADGPSRTRIELEHRRLERHAFAEDLRAGVDGKEGWPGLLERYAAAVKARHVLGAETGSASKADRMRAASNSGSVAPLAASTFTHSTKASPSRGFGQK